MAGEANGEYPTIIGPDAKFKGEMSFEKGVRVFGKFEGQIDSKGQLHVAEGATLQADVQAGNIQIDGEVKGNLVSSGKVQLRASAKMEGDLKTARLEVADGAVFVGNVAVGGDQAGKQAPAAPTSKTTPAPTGKTPSTSTKPNGGSKDVQAPAPVGGRK